ncbi:hypothetical protein [Nonomuraea zeae]|uniref:Uncharacterized protein n=1 Tax=Nonomuraea zeae TaxID=1642303 RepID=A0A5S4GMP2_9ACTN|nr:hypothetical protein [Nonomuraea zeae]TMR34218.1 hypothetical protein ETD85_17395 [Nonomuraea zeae]
MNAPRDGRAERRRLGRGRRRHSRLGAVASIALLLSGLLTPTAAHAGQIVPCPASITEWRRVLQTGRPPVSIWEGYRFTTLSVTPQFLISDGRQLDNNTDLSVGYEIQSSVSRTHSVSATTGVTANVGTYLTANVSSTIEMSRTTAIGVTLTVTVPPRTRLIAEYGVEGYNVSYAVEAWRVRRVGSGTPAPGDQCEEWGYYPQNTIAPTHLEGWRLRTA